MGWPRPRVWGAGKGSEGRVPDALPVLAWSSVVGGGCGLPPRAVAARPPCAACSHPSEAPPLSPGGAAHGDSHGAERLLHHLYARHRLDLPAREPPLLLREVTIERNQPLPFGAGILSAG